MESCRWKSEWVKGHPGSLGHHQSADLECNTCDEDRQVTRVQSGDPPTVVVQVDQFEGARGFAEASGRKRALQIEGVRLTETVALVIYRHMR